MEIELGNVCVCVCVPYMQVCTYVCVCVCMVVCVCLNVYICSVMINKAIEWYRYIILSLVFITYIYLLDLTRYMMSEFFENKRFN